MSEPTTEAGRALLADPAVIGGFIEDDVLREFVLAIEAEARDEQAAQNVALREALTECVRALADHRHGVTGKCEGCATITAVLALLASPAPAVAILAAHPTDNSTTVTAQEDE